MFSLANRRYTGAKTKLLDSINESILKTFDYRDKHNLSFFDVFCGTGVVSEYFATKPQFSHCIICFSKESPSTKKTDRHSLYRPAL